MYKNLLYSLLSAVLMLSATSCIYDGLESDAPSDQVEVTFNLDLEKTIVTKTSISDGSKVDKLVYAIYKINPQTGATEPQDIAGDGSGQVVVENISDFVSGINVSVPIAKDQKYRAVFWAQNASCTAYDTQNLADVKVSYENASNNDENRDAFFASLEFLSTDGAMYDVVLKRPFAQVNVGVFKEDWSAAVASGFVTEKSSAVIKNAATSINLLTGEVGQETADVEVNYLASAIPGETLYVNTDETTEELEEYMWLSMSYILVAERSDIADQNGIKGGSSTVLESAEFVFTANDGSSITLKEGLQNIPVQRNWRTNILGTILSGSVAFNITVDPAYLNDYVVDYLAPGVIYDEENSTYYLEGAAGMQWLAENLVAENGFEGKTIKLTDDIDLHEVDENGEPKCFDPIGSYKFDESFKGIFDGQNHTIKNLNQNTWALNNGYYYNDCGMGLFGALEEATIKNLIIDEASISGESALCGVVAAVAQNSTFENITVTNSQCADYQYYAGGIVGWVSGDNNNFIKCNVDASTVVGGQWGDFANSNGGIIGGVSSTAEIYMKDCNVACRIDAVNDVVSAYQYYAYRCCGMLIGNTNNTQDIDGTTYAAAPQLTCENVTVTYGEWMNYHYCEFAGTSYPYVRVEPGVSVDAYVNIRYGHPTDANGNTVVDENHVHNDGEDHNICIPFDQLLGGGPNGNGRNPVYGLPSFPGVKVNYPSEYTCPLCGQQHNVE